MIETPTTWAEFQERGNDRATIGDLTGAVEDYSQAILRRPSKGEPAGSVADFTMATDLSPPLSLHFLRGAVRRAIVSFKCWGAAIKMNLDRGRARKILPKIFPIENPEKLPIFSADDDAAEIHETLVDGPLTVEEAIIQASMLRTINERVKDGFYADKLVILTCLEKSGSTTTEICIREMLAQTSGIEHDVGIQKTLRWGPFSYVGQLYPEVLLYAINGGVLRSILQPLLFNYALLNVWGCAHVILLRHPADRLVGRYCDPSPPPLVGHDQRRWREDPQYLIPDIFDEKADMESVFDELINGGYLLDTLNWMANWLRVRDEVRSVVARYEDMQQAPIKFFENIHCFLYGFEMDEKLTDSISSYVSRYQKDLQPGDKAGRRYPKGYSGDVGIWRVYMTDKNLVSYRRIVDGFLRIHPNGTQLRAIYPDIMLE